MRPVVNAGLFDSRGPATWELCAVIAEVRANSLVSLSTWREIFREICRDRFVPAHFWLRMTGAVPPPMPPNMAS
jgi:hypothetical protein